MIGRSARGWLSLEDELRYISSSDHSIARHIYFALNSIKFLPKRDQEEFTSGWEN
jgi:hypothetical protein